VLKFVWGHAFVSSDRLDDFARVATPMPESEVKIIHDEI